IDHVHDLFVSFLEGTEICPPPEKPVSGRGDDKAIIEWNIRKAHIRRGFRFLSLNREREGQKQQGDKRERARQIVQRHGGISFVSLAAINLHCTSIGKSSGDIG